MDTETRIAFKLKLSLRDAEGPFMGKGLVQLLTAIEAEHSIRRAAAGMSLSYPKALRILRRLEEALGTRVVETSRGGVQGGGASVTEAGKAICRRFEAFNAALSNRAEELFDELFPGGRL